MSPRVRLKNRKASKAMYKPLPLNFLLGCSENALANFELARLDEMAQLRKELQLVLDRLLDQMSQAAIAGYREVGWILLRPNEPSRSALSARIPRTAFLSALSSSLSVSISESRLCSTADSAS